MFSAATETASARAEAGALVGGATGIDALLALQAADDVSTNRRKAIRRGHEMLDTLDGVKADLLAGRISEGKLNQLLSLVGQAREKTAPGLDGALDDVELRARVELAKFGRYAAA